MPTLTQLNRVIRGGQTERALAMIEPGAWLDEIDHDAGDTALTAAVYAKSIVVVEALLKAGAKLEVRNGTRETALHCACRFGLEDIVRVLVEAGADVHARTTSTKNDIDSGQTVIMKAVAGNKLPIVKLLIEKGADPLAKDDFGNNALSLANGYGKRIADYLAKTIAATGQKRLSVYDAVRTRALSRLQELLSGDVRLDEPEADSGKTPLHLAAEAAWLAGVELLLGRGVSVDAKDGHGQTPLMVIGHGKAAAEVARALLEAGADVNAQTHTGNSPLLSNDDMEVVKVLLAAGADPNRRNPVTGHTIFIYACSFAKADKLTAMIEAGADLDAVDNSGRGAEFYAKSNHRARALLAERRGAAMSPADRLRETLKELPKRAKDKAFIDYAEKLGAALNRKPAPWKKRKGAFYFHNVSLARVHAYFGEAMPASEDMRLHEAILARLAIDAREAGVTLFHSGQVDDPARRSIVLLPTTEPLAPAICCGTNANLRGDTNHVVEELLKISADHPFDIYGCGLDFVDARLRDAPGDARDLAARLIALCPELADWSDTPGSIRSVAEDLSRHGRFGLWWD